MTEGAVVLEWAIRGSLIDYIEGLADGIVAADGGARRSGDVFLFEGSLDGDGTYAFAGTIRLGGHMGLLDVALDDLQFCSDGTVTAGIGGHRVALATATNVTVDDTGTVRAHEVGLSADGAAVLGGVYQTGAPLAPLIIHPAQ